MEAPADPEATEAPPSAQDESEVLSPRSSWLKELDEIYREAQSIKLGNFSDPSSVVTQIEALATKLDTLAAARIEDQTMTEEGRHKWAEVASFLKGTAVESIGTVLSRGENLESLVNKAEELKNEAEQYQQPKILNCLCLSSIWDLIKDVFS